MLASLIGICPLCKAGCRVIFNNNKCDVEYNGKVILRGLKDPSTDLWTKPITPKGLWTTHPRLAPSNSCALCHTAANINLAINLAQFTHSICTCANSIKFSHQSLCSPRISTLLKAVHKGFLKGCPNLLEKLILEYLNPSPATAKGHMKRPHHGIKSMQPKTTQPPAVSPVPTTLPAPFLPGAPYIFPPAAVQPYPILHQANVRVLPHMILDDGNASIANVFALVLLPMHIPVWYTPT